MKKAHSMVHSPTRELFLLCCGLEKSHKGETTYIEETGGFYKLFDAENTLVDTREEGWVGGIGGMGPANSRNEIWRRSGCVQREAEEQCIVHIIRLQ